MGLCGAKEDKEDPKKAPAKTENKSSNKSNKLDESERSVDGALDKSAMFYTQQQDKDKDKDKTKVGSEAQPLMDPIKEKENQERIAENDKEAERKQKIAQEEKEKKELEEREKQEREAKEKQEREENERKEQEAREKLEREKKEEEDRLEKERFEKEEKERLAREWKEKNTVPDPWPKEGLPCDLCKSKIWGKDTAVKIDGVLQHRKCQEASKSNLPAPTSPQMRPSALIKDHKARMKKIQAQSAKKEGPRASYMLRNQISGMKKTVTETGMDHKEKDAPDSDLAAKLKKRAEETEAKEREDQRIREEKEKEKAATVTEPPKKEEVKDGKDAEGFPVPWPKGGLQCGVCHAKIWGRDTATMGDDQAIIHAKCKGVDSSQLKKSEDIAAKLTSRQTGEQTSVYTYTGKGNAPDIWQLIGAFDLHWIGLEPKVDGKTRTVLMPVDESTNVQVQEKEAERNDDEFWYTYTYPQPPPGLEFLKQSGLARMALTQENENVKFEWRVTFTGTKGQATELSQTLASAEPAVEDAYRAAEPEAVGESTTESSSLPLPSPTDSSQEGTEQQPSS